MYPPGHVGISALLLAPLGYLLFAANREREAFAWLGVALGITLLPDVDVFLPGVLHRGVTHTIPFAIIVGGAIACLAVASGLVLSTPSSSVVTVGRGTIGFAVGSGAVLSHLLGDVITPMGITPLFPVFDAVYTLELVYARNPAANLSFLLLGIAFFAFLAHRGRARAVATASDEAADGDDADSPLSIIR